MKTFVKLSILIPLFLTACSGTYQTTRVHDDIYFSPSNAEKMAENAPENNVTAIEITPSNESQPAGSYDDSFSENKMNYQENTDNQQYEYIEEPIESDSYYDEDGNLVVNNYYMDGYNQDFYYESRIRRFHRNWAHFGYYDPFFTNMYWYNYNPYYIGASIYMGYDPFYSLGYFPGSYYSWGYRPWAWAQYGYGWGYGNPWGGLYSGNYYGYNAGYHNGYWNNYYGYNYYGFGAYYGMEDYVLASRRPSNPITETDRAPGRYTTSNGIKNSNSSGAAAVGGGRYGVTPTNGNSGQTASDAENPGNLSGENNPRLGRTGSDQIRNTDNSSVFVDPQGAKLRGNKGRETVNNGTKPVAATPENLTDNNQQQQRQYTPQRNPQEYARPERVSQTPKYERPQQPVREGQPAQAAPNTNRTRTYTSPSQQQPRSNQEYRRPANEQRPTPATRQTEQQARPQRQSPQRPEAAPARQPVQTRPQATPQRTPSQQRAPQVNPQSTPQSRPQARPQRSAPQSRPQATPSRSTPQRRPQAAPQRSAPQSRPQAAPSRAPQRSTPSYTPSRSSGSSSSPSRSSGSSSRSSSPSRSR